MKRKYLAVFITLFLGISTYTFAVPKKVIIIRHAEKVHGTKYLSLQGLERAHALPYYFSGLPLYNNPPISHIFAAASKSNSIRPIQTCTPIAAHYNLPLNTDYGNHETDEITREFLTNPKYNDSSVLICWSHGHIRPLVLGLGAKDPGVWEHSIFDQVYMITFEDGKQPKFEKLLQKLMFGDRVAFDQKF